MELVGAPEWYLVIFLLGVLCSLATLWAPLLWFVPLLAGAILLPVGDAVFSALRTRFGDQKGRGLWRRRGITFLLHLIQPLARLVGRVESGLSPWRHRRPFGMTLPRRMELAFWCEDWRPPEERLAALDAALHRSELAVRCGGPFDRWDLEVRGGTFGAARILFAAEDHGGGTQYLRFRITPRPSKAGLAVSAVLIMLALGAAIDKAWIAALVVTLGAIIPLATSLAESGIAVAAARSSLDVAASPSEAAESPPEPLPTEPLGATHWIAGGSYAD